MQLADLADKMRYLLIPIFAFLYRCRGGFLPLHHTQLARLVYWTAPTAAWASFINPSMGWLCGVMAFFGLLIPHAEYQNDASAKSVAGMAVIGVARLALILLPLCYFNPFLGFIVPIGALQGLAYYIGYKFLDGKGWKAFAATGAGWGEVLTGAVFGLAFALV